MKYAFALVLLLASSVAFADTKYTFNLSIVTDWQTVQQFGGVDKTKQALQQRIDDASKIYEDQMQLKLNVSLWKIPTSQSDDVPFADYQYQKLLDDVVTYREASSVQCEQGATIFMSTRPFTDNIVGYSYLGSACWGNAAGIVQVNYGESYDSIIFAHEVGHILGASHDGDSKGSCPNVTTGEYIMTPEAIFNRTNMFSECSVKVITSQFAEHPCIHSTDPSPATIVPTGTSTTPNKLDGGGGAFEWTSIVCLVGVLGYTLRTKYRREYAHACHV